MLTIIHGEDVSLSRKKLNEEKEKWKEKKFELINLDGAKLQLTNLIQICDSFSIFSQNRLIVIENLLTGTVGKEKEQILQKIAESSETTEIILWEKKQIKKTVINKYFKKAKELNHKYPQILFSFLDSLGSLKPNTLVSNFHTLLGQKESELIFAMLIRQFRNLIIAKDTKNVKDIAGLQTWQAYKFKKQANYFTLTELINSYRSLLAIDYKIKSGLTPYSLKQLLDIFLLSL